jgi:hypothetical protein
MGAVIAILNVGGAAVLSGIALLFRKMTSRAGTLPVTAEWIDELSIERYRPMMRLLEEGDLEYLRKQPGFTPRMLTKLRIQRCALFRDYLHCLNADFGRVCAALKLVMLQSQQDRPDLAGALLSHQIQFAAGILGVHFRLLLYRWGFCGVDVSSLVQNFDMLRLELRTLVPSASAMTA